MSRYNHLPIYNTAFGLLKELYLRVPKLNKQYINFSFQKRRRSHPLHHADQANMCAAQAHPFVIHIQKSEIDTNGGKLKKEQYPQHKKWPGFGVGACRGEGG